jgi:hypothetical protein
MTIHATPAPNTAHRRLVHRTRGHRPGANDSRLLPRSAAAAAPMAHHRTAAFGRPRHLSKQLARRASPEGVTFIHALPPRPAVVEGYPKRMSKPAKSAPKPKTKPAKSKKAISGADLEKVTGGIQSIQWGAVGRGAGGAQKTGKTSGRS